jgi:hypothetical protein|tara:strand:+ start:5000 stop:5509 length:510 start_codon:yes stop_codon:yes gene_type:complete
VSSYRLTGKQLAFAQAVIDGMNNIDAYEAAGYSMRQGRATAIANACRLRAHSNVAAWIDAKRAAIEAKAVTIAGYTKDVALTNALDDRKLARELGQSGSAVSAGKLAADLCGHLVERHETKLVGGWDSVLDSVGQSARGLPTPDANAPVAPHQADDDGVHRSNKASKLH